MNEGKEGRLHPAFWVILGVALGAGSVGMFTFNTHDTHEGAVEGESVEAPSHSELLSILDQSGGMAVVAGSVAVPPPGVWLAIHEYKDNTLGAVLGAARVRFQSTNVSVPLLRETLPGATYAAVLYRDDGDDEFSLERDSVYVDFESGARVEIPFRTNP